MVCMVMEGETVGCAEQGFWKVVKELGSGAYGEVFEVINTETGKEGAMKAVKHSDADLEASALKTLASVPIVYVPIVYAQFPLSKEYTAIVMEIGAADLGTLRANNPNGVFTKKTSLSIAHHVVSALWLSHENGWIHRDVKEANIVLKKESEIQHRQPLLLIDFGIAYPIGNPELQKNQPPFEESVYCSPAMAQGKPPQEKDDLIMTLYMLMTGRGYDEFSDPKTSLMKRLEFEQDPFKYITKPEDKWLGDIAKIIFAVEDDQECGYEAILDILAAAEKDFKPALHRFVIEGDENKPYIL
ncbi:hypothetical protein CAEBREN_08574 [Caenorhabditis brenneri]|uniref:Protein kinase domain-containing protein n=1 Tax=Caenorhabditis brenneri TaxID=135651 RepID=G0P2T5_CAEBE|nr:hypothetical protein CAEBREN_08574 [Caenorhabditis brenneri]